MRFNKNLFVYNKRRGSFIKIINPIIFILLSVFVVIVIKTKGTLHEKMSFSQIDKLERKNKSEFSIEGEIISPQFSRPTGLWENRTNNPIENYEYIVPKEVPLYRLEISQEDTERIETLVDKMKSQKFMLEEDRIWFPAKFYENGKIYDVKVRMRGDYPVHWENPDYRSWRIKFPKNNLFHGVRLLNFIIASDRVYYIEAMSFHLARKYDLLTFRDTFARLSINDKQWCIYYVVEAPTKEFLEVNKRPQSAIFRRRDYLNEMVARNKQGVFGPYGWSFKNYIPNKERNALYQASFNRILKANSYKEYENILNIDKFAKFEAICTIFGTYHALQWHNYFFYFDETTGLVEPIIWDVNLGGLHEDISKGIELGPKYEISKPQSILIQNPKYRYMRDKIIWNLINDDYESIFETYDYIHASLNPLYKKWLDQKDYDKYMYWVNTYCRPILQRNIRILKKELEYSKVFVAIEIKNETDANALNTIKIRNSSFSPVYLEEIQIDAKYSQSSSNYTFIWDKNKNGELDDGDVECGKVIYNEMLDRLIIRPGNEILIYSKLVPYNTGSNKWMTTADEETFFFTGGTLKEPPDKFHFSLINKVTGKLVEESDIWTTLENSKQLHQVFKKSSSIQEFLQQYPEFKISEADKRVIVLNKGVYEFKNDVIVPKGYVLKIKSGARLRFAPNKSLFCYSQLKVEGSEKSPVYFEPINKKEGFGVIAVVGPQKEKSELNWAIFSGYGEASFANTFFSGGVSFHSVPVDIRNCQFLDGKGEDALNLKSSTGIIDNCSFKNNPSDAIDLDWSDVPIVNSYFENSGGDSIDVSGSNTIFQHNIIMNSHDKGISLGENSKVVIFDTFINGCDIGVAVKDLSEATILSSTIMNNRIGIASYQKKAIFGGGKTDVFATVLDGNKIQSALDPWSSIVFKSCILQKEKDTEGENYFFKPTYKDIENSARIVVNGNRDKKTTLSNYEKEYINRSINLTNFIESSRKYPIGFIGDNTINGKI